MVNFALVPFTLLLGSSLKRFNVIRCASLTGGRGIIRDWSLITGRGGGATEQEGGAREVLPL